MRPTLTLSLALTGLSGPDASTAEPRGLIDLAASLGYRAVQLDAAMPGLRPRDLDRSARRDLAAILRRHELAFSGLDLWIPPDHFINPGTSDRASDAVRQAVELAAELSGLVPSLGSGRAGRVVSLILPAKLDAALHDDLASAATSHGVMIADHAWPPRQPPAAPGSPVGVGIDPAAIILAGHDPSKEVGRLAGPPASARLTDLASQGRVPPGEGSLDELEYTIALDVRGYRDAVVLDTRGLVRPTRVARDVLQRWTGFGAGSS